MVAEFWLTDPLPELALGNVLVVFGVSEVNRRFFEVAPKNRTKVEDEMGVVYRIPCGGCNKVYVGETKRSVGDGIKEHTAKIANNVSAVADHHQKTGHEPDLDNVKVLCREDKLLPHKVCEAIFIKKETSPTLNRNGGVWTFKNLQFTSRNTKNY